MYNNSNDIITLTKQGVFVNYPKGFIGDWNDFFSTG